MVEIKTEGGRYKSTTR